MRAIRNMLLSTNKKEDLQCWVMILLSVKLYLRAEEVCSIRLEHFLKEWFVVDETSGKVKALAVQIKDKTDDDWLRFFIYRSDDCPEFCAMRHLLAYLHSCEITGDHGWTFPNLNARSRHVPYDSFLRSMRARFTDLLDRRLPLTCHSLRKTGYLFAIWGDARIDVIRLDARHTCTRTSLSYEQDAVTMMSYANISTDENAVYEVPRYKAVRVINQAVGVMLSSEVSNVRELSSLAKLYVERDLRVAPVAEFYRTPLILMKRAERGFFLVEESPLVSLRELMKANMPLGKYDDAIVLLGQLVRSVGLEGNDIEAQDQNVETGSSPKKSARMEMTISKKRTF